jgi:hypothetical protein
MATIHPRQPGSPLVIGAHEWNALRAGAQAALQRQLDAAGTPTRATPLRPPMVLVHNNTETNLERGRVLGIDGPMNDPAESSDHEAEFLNLMMIDGVQPTEDHIARYVVLIEPAAAEAVALAATAGVVAARVHMHDEAHRYADVKPEAHVLQSAGSGSAEILYVEPGTGEKWAVVRLGGQGGTIFARITGKGDSDGEHKGEEVVRESSGWTTPAGGRQWTGVEPNLPQLIEVNGRVEIADGTIVEVRPSFDADGDLVWLIEKDQGDQDGDEAELAEVSDDGISEPTTNTEKWDRDDQGEKRGAVVNVLTRVYFEIPDEEGCPLTTLNVFHRPATIDADGHVTLLDEEATPYEFLIPNNAVALDKLDVPGFLVDKLRAQALDNNGEEWIYLEEKEGGDCGNILVIGHRDPWDQADAFDTVQSIACEPGVEEGSKVLSVTGEKLSFDAKGHNRLVHDATSVSMELVTVTVVTDVRVDESSLKLQKKTRTVYVPCADAESDWIDVHTGEDCEEEA